MKLKPIFFFKTILGLNIKDPLLSALVICNWGMIIFWAIYFLFLNTPAFALSKKPPLPDSEWQCQKVKIHYTFKDSILDGDTAQMSKPKPCEHEWWDGIVLQMKYPAEPEEVYECVKCNREVLIPKSLSRQLEKWILAEHKPQPQTGKVETVYFPFSQYKENLHAESLWTAFIKRTHKCPEGVPLWWLYLTAGVNLGVGFIIGRFGKRRR